jgi:FdrA protein
MQLQRGLANLSEVEDAGVVMATPANLELMQQNDLLPDEAMEARPEDLLIVVRAKGANQAETALGQVDELLAARRSTVVKDFHPKSLKAAAGMVPEPGWVLVSVPGRYAADVSREALELNRHVFLYSDNVSLEDEISLKDLAGSKGLLLMGPDCGTAIINGIGLGFANRVRRGSIGIVAAAGTGLQAVSSRIHTLGQGISHAIGTGGRDMKVEVGGSTAQQGLDLLARDPQTSVIILISKPPDPAVARRLLKQARASGKPVVINFIGYAQPARKIGNLHFASSLYEAADTALELHSSDAVDAEPPAETEKQVTRRYVRGLFSGGTLAGEAFRGLQVVLGQVYSNVAPASEVLPDPLQSQGHTILDLGEDVFTVGRLHPMIDNDLRLRQIRREAADPEVAMILLDVVLGDGAHPDPASELGPAIAAMVETHGIEVVVIMVGTDEDPQDLKAQRRALEQAGARVFGDSMAAVTYIGERIPGVVDKPLTGVPLEHLMVPVAAINIGLETFYTSLSEQGVEVVHVDWRPPAGGDEKLMSILEKMR